MTEKMAKEMKELALWRLETLPPNIRLAIGNKGAFTKEELKEHLQKEDEIGRLFVEMELNFIKALSSGEFAKAMAE